MVGNWMSRKLGEHKSKRGHFRPLFCLKTFISFSKQTFLWLQLFDFQIESFRER